MTNMLRAKRFATILRSHRTSRLLQIARNKLHGSVAPDLLRLHFFQIVDARCPDFKRLHGTRQADSVRRIPNPWSTAAVAITV